MTDSSLCTNIVSTMQTQTVFRAGNSEVVAIPPEVKKKTGVKIGSKITVGVATDGKTIVINQVGSKSGDSVLMPEFYSWLKEFNKKYGSALEELARK